MSPDGNDDYSQATPMQSHIGHDSPTLFCGEGSPTDRNPTVTPLDEFVAELREHHGHLLPATLYGAVQGASSVQQGK